MARPKELESPTQLTIRVEEAVRDVLVKLSQEPRVKTAVNSKVFQIRKNSKGPGAVSQGDVVAFLILQAGESLGILDKNGLLKQDA